MKSESLRIVVASDTNERASLCPLIESKLSTNAVVLDKDAYPKVLVSALSRRVNDQVKLREKTRYVPKDGRSEMR